MGKSITRPEPCPKCGGRMNLDYWSQSCSKCRESGATVCEDCWTHYEWQCSFGCGRVEQLPRIRRRDDPYRKALANVEP